MIDGINIDVQPIKTKTPQKGVRMISVKRTLKSAKDDPPKTKKNED